MLHIQYSDEVKATMIMFYKSLTEKDRRRYAECCHRSNKIRLWWSKVYMWDTGL